MGTSEFESGLIRLPKPLGQEPFLAGWQESVREVSVSSKQTREVDLAGVRREQRPW